jgi:hypothetical protein
VLAAETLRVITQLMAGRVDMRRAKLFSQLASKFRFMLVVLGKIYSETIHTVISYLPGAGTVVAQRKHMEMGHQVEVPRIYELGEWHYPTGLLLQVAAAVVAGPMRKVALAVDSQG